MVASTVAEIRRGDRIVFVTTGATAMIARLVRQDEDGLHLEGIRPAAPSRPMQAQFVPQGELLLVARIIWVSQ
jgi:phage repressor protein C with HTH and peptisase S24 domain